MENGNLNNSTIKYTSFWCYKKMFISNRFNKNTPQIHKKTSCT